MLKKIQLFLLLFISSITLKSYAQIDTEFWFVVPEVSKTFPNTLDSPIVFRIVTYESSATVTIEQPASGGMPSSTITIPANTTHTIPLSSWLNILENRPANTILNKGIKITSTAPISAYYEVITGFGSYYPRRDNPEIFTLKGKLALGHVFSIPAQNLLNLDYERFNPDPTASFDIVATENNTRVTITPRHSIFGHIAMTPFTFILNKGQTYSAVSTSPLNTAQLNGSKIVSDKPIAVTVKQDGVRNNSLYYGLCADLCGEQIIPTRLLGTSYIAINGNLNGVGSYIFINGIVNGTNVYKNGILQGSVNAGETLSFPIGADACFIESSQIINVYQLSGVGCEFGATQLPKIECTGSTNVSYTLSTNEQLWLNIFTQPSNINYFKINGESDIIVASDFSYVPGTDEEWMYTRKNLTSYGYIAGTILNVTNDNGHFHLGILDGGLESGSNYGYFSNYGAKNFTYEPIELSLDTQFCLGDSIILTFPPESLLISWSDGSTESTQTIYETGVYWVQYLMSGCIVYTQKYNVTVNDCTTSNDEHSSNKTSIQFEVIPNPFNNDLKVIINKPLHDVNIINIFDQLGKKVFSKEYSENEVDIDLSYLSDGIYFIQINNSELQKIIKK